MAWRIFDEDGKGQADIISLDSEVIEEGKEIMVYDMDPEALHKTRILVPYKVEKLLYPFIVDGELVAELPSITEKKNYIKDQLENRVWESELRPEMPHKHYVDLTMPVYLMREDLYRKLHGGEL